MGLRRGRGEGEARVELALPKVSAGFAWLDKQVAAPPDEPVRELEFFYGRTAKNKETVFRVRDLRAEAVR